MHFKVQRIENTSPKDRFLLTKELALFRSNQVQNVAYELYFIFKSMSNYYRVETTITFDLNNTESLLIDCGCSTINKIIVNNVDLSPNIIKRIWKMNALCIPKEYLCDGRNVIYVKACNKFSKNGSGFHSFLDQNRKKEYCYTVCPPNFAHLIYPCFDQPDLKAHFGLTVKAPSKWTVVSNMTVLETRRAPLSIFTGGRNTIWTFRKSPKISTYLFSMAAGDYMTVEPDTSTLVPMRLYCASDKYNYLVQQKQDFFDLAQAGIKFYNQFFGVDFPFEKYDQIFCPESKYMAMENPGMVCITENYIFLTQTSPSRKIQRAVTLLHELSHMWFGNLVTMKWWDDLWLNEGFATFISYHSLGQVSQDPLFKDLDVDFFCYKQDALEIDGLNSTHPVTQNVKDTEDATNIFDDITYAKGSAVLKHLMYIIGEQNFSKALTTYFERYRWSNADSKDFFGVIQEVLLEDETRADNYFNMEKWVSDWVETEGKQNISYDMNFVEGAVEISVKCENLPQRVSVIKHVCLETAVFCLDEHDRLTLFTSQKFYFSEEDTTLIIPLGNIDPQRVGVVLNYKDYAYVDVIMDDVSMDFFLKNFSQLEPLVKVQLFFSMVKKVQLGRSSPIQLFKHISDEFGREEIPYLYSEYLICATKIFDLYLSESIKEDCAKIIFPSLFKLLNTSRTKESDEKMVGLRFTVQEYIANFAYTNSDVLALFHWTQEIQPLTNYEQKSGLLIGKIIEEIFWRKLLDDNERDDIKRLYAAEQPYYFNFVLGATASLNDKWVLWKKYVYFRDSVQSQYEISCIMKGFNNPYSKDREIFAEKFFEDVILVFETHEAEYNTTFFTHLFPKHCKLDYAVEKVNNLLTRENICSNLRSLLEKKLQQLEISLQLEKFSQCKS